MMRDFYGYFENEDTFSSDLACERRRADLRLNGVDFKKDVFDGYAWERIRITTEEGAESIGRPIGTYDTLTLPRMDTMDEEAIDDAANEIAKELCSLFDKLTVYPERLLVTGLGNGALTPDSIGPKTAALVNATMHIKRFDRRMFNALECSEIAVIAPGVMADSGMEAADMVSGISEIIRPDAILAIDSLASSSPERLGTTIQISDTGIFPGSGIGNRRRPINEALLGVPVIAIGVPTVIDSRVFLHGDGVRREKCEDFMFVSPQQIDGISDSAARIISTGINQAFGIL